MKTAKSLALSALAFIVSLVMTSTSMAAVTVMTKISLTPISWDRAYDNTAENTLSVSTGNAGIYMSWKISNEGEYFTLNSMSIDIATVGNPAVIHEEYSTYSVGNVWSRLGSYTTNSYLYGPMNQGGIVVGLAILNSFSPYIIPVNPGDIWKVTMTYDVVGQGPLTSYATITDVSSIPEMTSGITFTFVSSILLLRRKRK